MYYGNLCSKYRQFSAIMLQTLLCFYRGKIMKLKKSSKIFKKSLALFRKVRYNEEQLSKLQR